MYKKLLNETLTYALAAMCVKVASFMVIPLLTNELSPKNFGLLELLITISSITVPLIILNIHESQLKFGLENNDKIKKDSTIFNTLVVVKYSFCILLILTIISSFILYTNGYENMYLVIIMLLLVMSEALKLVLLNTTRIYSRLLNYFISELANASLFFVFCYLLIVQVKMDYQGYFLALVLGNLISILYLSYTNKLTSITKAKNVLINKSLQLNLIKFSLPLVPNAVLWWIISASDKLMVSALLGLNYTGYFAVASKIPAILSMMYAILLKSWQSFIYSNKQNKHITIFSEKILTSIYIFTFIIYFIVEYYSDYLIVLISNTSYLDASSILPTLVLASCYMAISSFLGAELMLHSKTSLILKTSLIGGGINIALSYLFIRWIGLEGASLSTLFSACVMISIRLKYTKRSKKTNTFFLGLTFTGVLVCFLKLLN
ncbi:MAG: hypothetical protein C0425_10815 [Chlorobiaceae bacterium]|nr:hypothetical protein [Chlorobiaceae bacterium]